MAHSSSSKVRRPIIGLESIRSRHSWLPTKGRVGAGVGLGLGLGLGSANLVVDELNILPLNTLALVFNLFALENVPVELRRVRGHRLVGMGSWALVGGHGLVGIGHVRGQVGGQGSKQVGGYRLAGPGGACCCSRSLA